MRRLAWPALRVPAPSNAPPPWLDEAPFDGEMQDARPAPVLRESAIIAETQSRNTEESARRIAVIARVNGLRRMVIASLRSC